LPTLLFLSFRGSTGKYRGVNKEKHTIKETSLTIVENRQTQQVNLPLYYNAYRAPNQQVGRDDLCKYGIRG